MKPTNHMQALAHRNFCWDLVLRWIEVVNDNTPWYVSIYETFLVLTVNSDLFDLPDRKSILCCLLQSLWILLLLHNVLRAWIRSETSWSEAAKSRHRRIIEPLEV